MRVVVRRAGAGLHGARAREEARRDEGLPAVCQAHPEPLRDVPGLRRLRRAEALLQESEGE